MENTLIFTSEKEVRFGKLLKFIIPTYLTSLFNTVYTIIDGIFVSAYVGTDALASINIVYPIVNVLTGIALVFATGGSAVAALHIGGNRKAEGDRSFSVSTVAAILLGCLISLLVLANLSAILSLLGATDITIAGCITYARWWLLAAPVVIGKELFTYFIRVDSHIQFSDSFIRWYFEYHSGLCFGRTYAHGNLWCGTGNDSWTGIIIYDGNLLLYP